MGFIYKITNLINKKVYIGQTSRNVNLRWAEHVRHANSLRHLALSQAILKYGAENFLVETLEEVSNNQLNEREIFWIKTFNSYEGDGYNMTPGGGCDSIASTKKKIVLCYSLSGDFIKKYESLAAASHEVGVNYSAISRCAARKEGYYSSAGFIWRFSDSPLQEGELKKLLIEKEKKEKQKLDKLSKCFSQGVSKIEISTGRILCQYPSMADASKKENESKALICNDCKKKKITPSFKRNYIWQKNDELKESPFYQLSKEENKI